MAVYATARKVESIADLEAMGMRTLRLDVTDEPSMVDAVARMVEERGVVDVLVNSAGYGLSGAVEEVPLPEVRRQFETNVFGQTRLTQLVLKGMRQQRSGTIVNLSSVFGRYAVPGGGFYGATKHAVEALSDALRLEVAGFGVRVVIIQPGPVRTEFGDTYVGNLAVDGAVYEDFRRRIAEYFEAIYHGTRRTLAGALMIEPDDVAG
jgi:NAD(P)-dependent dehydrogenase (short-subunit alcohol dehydrogenase family)